MERSPNLAIPDNTAAGVSDTISIAASGIVRHIQVAIEIPHTYIGDLQVELFSPPGHRALFHGRQGGSRHDLIASYNSDRPGELGALVGQPMQGDWILRVSDRAAVDVGTLRKWSLEIEAS